ncbi:MAG: hypothetical protein V4598_02805 [Bdellovibrionota bacterium]
MRWLALTLTVLAISLGIAAWVLWRYPSSLYTKWMKGEGWNRYYQISNFRPLLLRPIEIEPIEEYKEEYPELWKDFPLRSTMLPLPVRHPFFVTVPILEYDKKGKSLQLGMSFMGPGGRENSRIYVLPSGVQKDYSTGLDLFKLPYVKNRILSKTSSTLWTDIFTKTLEPKKDQTLDEMIYDLYLLYIRSMILPKETIRYGIISGKTTAIIELMSKDKDYIMEMVMIQEKGNLFSYVLRTEKNNEESRKLRSKFLTTITFSPTDTDMSRILYTEFKQLNFTRQVDQEGMLYLFSAWSQDTNNIDILKEMIFYLERGSKYHKHLSTFYKYSYAKYGKTFTTRDIFTDQDDNEIALQRKIELEAIGKGQAAVREKTNEAAPELTPDERMNMYLKKAKEAPVQKKDEMTIH